MMKSIIGIMGIKVITEKKNDKKHHRHHEVNKNFLLDNSNIKDLIYNANDFPIQHQY